MQPREIFCQRIGKRGAKLGVLVLVSLLFPASCSGAVCVCGDYVGPHAPTLGDWISKCCLHKVKDQDFLPSLTCFSWAFGRYEERRVGSRLYHPLCRGDVGSSRWESRGTREA